MKDIDFEQELYNHFGQVKDFTLGMRIGQYFYNLGRDSVPLPEDTVLFNKGVAEGKRLMIEELSEHIAAAYQLGLATHNPNIEPKVELIYTKDTTPADGKELLYVSDKSYKIGWRDCKEQMMKEAVEGEVVKDISNKLAVTAKNVNLDKFKFGEKVRIIIVKEDEK